MNRFKSQDFFVFGYFGYVTNQLDGQTVKTRSVHQLFQENLQGNVPYYDTERLKFDKLGFFITVFKILKSKHVIYLPAHRNLKNFFPVLYFLSIIFRIKIHYFVIGGWLQEFIKANNKIGNRLKKVKTIYVETNKMLNDLKALGFDNVHWFPNFRTRHENIPDRLGNADNVFKMVFMSRINLLKGIDVIFRFLEWANKKDVYQQIQLDFYGQVDEKDKSYFFENIEKYPTVNYKGVLQPDQVQHTLTGYDLFLFPTRYPGEGCPGAIIDAYMASLPVVASDWRYNAEFVKDGETGFIFKLEEETQFYEIIVHLQKNKKELSKMQHNAFAFSENFTPESAWVIVNNKIT